MLDAWQAEGLAVGRAVLVRTYGSAPRQEGAVLLYAEDGRLVGSVSGGCVEGAVASEIEASRKTGKTRTIRYGITDEQAWGVGLACGGTIEVLIEPTVPLEAVDAARSADATVLITPLPTGAASAPQRKLTFQHNGGLRGTTGDARIDAELITAADGALLRGASHIVELGERQFFLETFPLTPRLVIVGAVEIARPLVRLAHELGFATVVIDARPAFATRERFPDADRLIVGWPDEVASEIELSADDSVAILTHDPKFDEPAIKDALRRGCRYVGAIGSKKTQAERRQRLRAAGISEDELARLHGPIWLDLGGRAPAETALAILAEVVVTRYQATGKPLRNEAAASPSASVPAVSARS